VFAKACKLGLDMTMDQWMDIEDSWSTRRDRV